MEQDPIRKLTYEELVEKTRLANEARVAFDRVLYSGMFDDFPISVAEPVLASLRYDDGMWYTKPENSCDSRRVCLESYCKNMCNDIMERNNAGKRLEGKKRERGEKWIEDQKHHFYRSKIRQVNNSPEMLQEMRDYVANFDPDGD